MNESIRTRHFASEKYVWNCRLSTLLLLLLLLFNLTTRSTATTTPLAAVPAAVFTQILNVDQVQAINQNQVNYNDPIWSMRRSNENENNKLLMLTGSFIPFKNLNFSLIPTFSNKVCDYTSEPLKIIYRNDTQIVVSYDHLKHGQLDEAYLCYSSSNVEQHHLGAISRFELNKSSAHRLRRDAEFGIVKNERSTTLSDIDFKPKKSNDKTIRIYGYRIESSDSEVTYTADGVPELLMNSKVKLRLFGSGFTDKTIVTFTDKVNVFGGPCLYPASEQFRVDESSVMANTAVVEVVIPKGSSSFFFCTREAESDAVLHLANQTHPFIHQGAEDWFRIHSYEKLIPIWCAILIVVICLCFSALFSGLNLGLMSLDRTELKILKNTGTGKERKHASKIQPVRDHGNFLLCSILLGNVLVNSTCTILLDGLSSGLLAVVMSTLLIVVFGEITPQAICSRHGLAVGANTILITKGIMVLTFPISYPISKLLDCLLGEEIGAVYNRERLKELVRVTNDVNDLDKDEVNIISGALELRKKTVADVMTHIEDAFMLSIDAILDFETVSEIMKSGFSRIPVYENDRQNVFTLLFIKDLAFVDPDDNTPLRTLCEFYQNPCHFVFDDCKLDVLFRQFKEGHKGHMAFVHQVNNTGDGDPFYETIGLITLEDVIEELIQAEIMDETDVYTDNRAKIKRNKNKNQDFTIFAERREVHRLHISPQLTLATFQYLTTSVDAFKSNLVSETIVRRLLNQDVVHHIKSKGKERTDPSLLIYQQGKPVDYFVLILEGRVEVTVGRENLMFESGPFTYFGTQALMQSVGVDSPLQQQPVKGSIQSLNIDAMLRHTFVPDYSVRAVTEVFYITIKRTLYLAAKRATLMEQAQRSGDISSVDPLDDEVEMLLHSLDEDDRSINAHTTNLNAVTPRASKPTSKTPSPTQLLNSGISLSNLPLDMIDNNVVHTNNSIAKYNQDELSTTPLINHNKI